MTYLAPAGAQQGTTVEVSAGGTFDKWPVEVWVSGKGVTAKAAKDKGKLAVTVSPDATPGTYWFRLHNETGASTPRPFVVGTLAELSEKEPNDSPVRPRAVELPAVVNGRLAKSGDVDCFAVKLREGQTLVAAAEANRTLRSPMDAVIQIASADGFVLEQANDHAGLDPLATFAAPKDGTYIVRVFAFPSTPDSSIRFHGSEASVYRLTLTSGGYADHAWPLAVSRDKPGKVDLAGWNIPEAARSGVKPQINDDHTAVVFHPAVAGAVPVAVESHPCWIAAEARKQSGPLVPPFTISGRLDNPERGDRFAVPGKKGQPLTIRCESPSLGFALCPVVTVRDSAGKVLSRTEPRKPDADAEVKFTPPADGTFTIEVHDLYRLAGPRHAYRLTIRPPQPDFALTIATDRISCEPKKPSDVEVKVDRQDGFRADVALTVEGLPKGVTAVVVKPKGKSDPSKLTLRFTATGPYKPGPIRVVGTAGVPALKRTATAALSDFGTETADLWLSAGTVPPVAKKKKR